jgi:hypothetical protein
MPTRVHTLVRSRLLPILALVAIAIASVAATSHIPTVSSDSVAVGESVTIRTHNFPPNQTCTVTMGPMGSRGINGTVVGTLQSGAGGTLTATYTIPDGLKDDAQVSIRLQTSHSNPWYAYNWFWNDTVATTPVDGTTPAYTGIPTFRITSVEAGNSVTIETSNFPANQTFTVTMGKMFTRGIGGTVVGTLESGEGGTLTATYAIPAALQGDSRIAIRAQTSHSNPYYAYNWFWNTTADGGDGAPDDGSSGTGGIPGYVGIPTFTVCSVTQNDSVTIVTRNFPPNQTFTVTMGPMFSRGIGGTVVGTLDSGAGGRLVASYDIPAGLQGSYRVAIRTQTAHTNPYYAYNWFWNSTATVCPTE